MNKLSKEDIQEIDDSINYLLNLHRDVSDDRFKLPAELAYNYGDKEGYKRMLEFKIKKLLNTKLDNLSQTEKDFEQLMTQLRLGQRVEKEHDVSDIEAAKISIDHLEEDPKYYTNLKKIHEKKLPFDDLYTLAASLDKVALGLIEPIKIEGIDAEMISLIDSGNTAYNVLHGVDIKDNGNTVMFKTHDGIKVTKDKIDEITIHVGAGHDEHRPVVEFTIEIGGKVYPDVRFSIGDRTENQHPVLIGVDFLKQIGAIIDVNKE